MLYNKTAMNTKLSTPICPFHKRHTSCTKQIRLFHALPEEVQSELITSASSFNRPKGYVFASDGDRVSSIIIIRKGNIKTYRLDASGNEYLLDVLHEEQAIWHDMFLKDPVYHYSIEAMTDVEICEISTDTFLSVLNAHPEAALSLIQMLSTELTAAKEKILLLSIRSPEVRTAGFLLDRWKKADDKMIFFKLEDIASTISLRPETISRILRRFEKAGIIARIGKGKICIMDQPALREIFRNGDQT